MQGIQWYAFETCANVIYDIINVVQRPGKKKKVEISRSRCFGASWFREWREPKTDFSVGRKNSYTVFLWRFGYHSLEKKFLVSVSEWDACLTRIRENRSLKTIDLYDWDPPGFSKRFAPIDVNHLQCLNRYAVTKAAKDFIFRVPLNISTKRWYLQTPIYSIFHPVPKWIVFSNTWIFIINVHQRAFARPTLTWSLRSIITAKFNETDSFPIIRLQPFQNIINSRGPENWTWAKTQNV